MAGGGLTATLERSRSRGEGGHSRSESETRPITETRLSSFDSVSGEQVLTRGVGVGEASMREWAMLVEPASEGAVAMSVAGPKKKVMVVIDGSRESRLAMLWALSHIVHQADTLSLIQFNPAPHKCYGFHRAPPGLLSSHRDPQGADGNDVNLKSASEKIDSRRCQLGLSLKTLCTARRPEVEVEMMIAAEGVDKGSTIVTQAKKLGASVLVLGQRKPSLLQRIFHQRSVNDEVVEYCIQNAECLTLAVRKKSKHMGGYLINSRWQKNFWLLA